MMLIIMLMIIIMIIIIIMTREYWVDFKLGVVLTHGVKDPLCPQLVILLGMVS